MKTSELIGPALAWAVFLADDDSDQVGIEDGKPVLFYADSDGGNVPYRPDIDWSQGGPIIERAHISLDWVGSEWSAKSWVCIGGKLLQQTGYAYGLTPLIAAMRCFVSSKLGDEIDIPKELQ